MQPMCVPMECLTLLNNLPACQGNCQNLSQREPKTLLLTEPQHLQLTKKCSPQIDRQAKREGQRYEDVRKQVK